jgi:hypothetical protein
MGKGEWSVWRLRTELPKESNHESYDALCQLELGLAATVAQELQIPGDFKMAMKLRRCSTDLIREAEVTTEGFSEREPVRRTRQRIRTLPSLKRRELLHGGNLVLRPGSRDIVFVRAGAKLRISDIPFPFPHSPFPGV